MEKNPGRNHRNGKICRYVDEETSCIDSHVWVQTQNNSHNNDIPRIRCFKNPGLYD
jgi:hypothetical protein